MSWNGVEGLFMRFLRPAVALLTVLALLVRAASLAQAQELQPPPSADAHWHEPDEATLGRDPAQTTPPATPVPPAPAQVGGQTVLVHLNAESGVRLEMNTSVAPKWSTSGWQADDAWSLVCDSPCDRPLPLGREYRLVGLRGVRPSRPFFLEASPGQSVLVTATAASDDAFAGGVVLIVLGSLAIPGG